MSSLCPPCPALPYPSYPPPTPPAQSMYNCPASFLPSAIWSPTRADKVVVLLVLSHQIILPVLPTHYHLITYQNVLPVTPIPLPSPVLVTFLNSGNWSLWYCHSSAWGRARPVVGIEWGCCPCVRLCQWVSCRSGILTRTRSEGGAHAWTWPGLVSPLLASRWNPQSAGGSQSQCHMSGTSLLFAVCPLCLVSRSNEQLKTRIESVWERGCERGDIFQLCDSLLITSETHMWWSGFLWEKRVNESVWVREWNSDYLSEWVMCLLSRDQQPQARPLLISNCISKAPVSPQETSHFGHFSDKILLTQHVKEGWHQCSWESGNTLKSCQKLKWKFQKRQVEEVKGELQSNMVRLVEREGKLEDLDRKVLIDFLFGFWSFKLCEDSE